MGRVKTLGAEMSSAEVFEMYMTPDADWSAAEIQRLEARAAQMGNRQIFDAWRIEHEKWKLRTSSPEFFRKEKL